MSRDWQLRQLDAPFGIEIDADFSRPLSLAQAENLRVLLYDNQLIVARGQTLSPEQHVALIRNIGTVLGTPDTVGYISNVREDGGLGNTEIVFHSDLAFTSDPYRVISLYAVDVVDGASSTVFASGLWGCQKLSAPLRERVTDLTVRHVYGANYQGRNRLSTVDSDDPWAVHPVIVAHPVTGAPILYVHQNQTDRIMELEEEASETLLATLFDALYQAENRYQHHWHRGDIVIWDNLALQHARGNISKVGNRTLHKAVVAEKSYFDLCPMKSPEGEQDHARQYSTPQN